MKKGRYEKKEFSELEIKSININPGEIAAPDRTITVVFSSPVEVKSAQSGFHLIPDVRGNVRFSADNTKATWVPASKMAPGSYTLLIENIADKSGLRTVRKRRIQFVVPNNWRSFPKTRGDHYVISMSKTKLPLSGQQFDLAKIFDPASNKVYQVAIDEKGNKIKFDEVMIQSQKKYLEKYGKLQPKLYEEIEKRGEKAKIPVAVWLAIQDDDVNKAKFDIEALAKDPRPLLGYRTKLSEAQSKFGNLIAEKFAIKVKTASKLAPVLILELTPIQVRDIANLKEVSGLYLYEKEGVEDLDDSMAASDADYVVDDLGYDGSDVRVGVWEGGADVKTNLVIEAEYDTTPSQTSSHTRLVTGIIKNTKVNERHGYAPDCRVYAANDTDMKALEWAVNDQYCTVINQSFHRSSEPQSGDLSFDDIYKDYLVLHYPYPTIIQAAGNYFAGDPDTQPNQPGGTSAEFVNHKGYNSLAVGNHSDDLSAMSGSTVFVNPNSPHGDRELPEICANGEQVTAAGATNSGTSFASPAVAGTVALLQEINSTLRYWPEGTRAILLAAALRNISGNSWIQDLNVGVDGVDGSGALNAAESSRIALNREQRNNSGVSRGWDVGTLRPEDFENGLSKFSYKVRVPSRGWWWPRRVKVALAWDSKVTHIKLFGFDLYWDNLTLDYDLLVYDGNTLVASSSSWDNSYEIVDFLGEPGKTYDIKIRKYSGNDWSWYGLAWTVQSLILEFKGIAALPISALIT
jgi:uncharacterized protein (DUF2147 family)